MPTDTQIIDPSDFDSFVDLKPDAMGRVGMALSGGGYKAALYHLGALWRVNEIGRLGHIKRFSSVSGGSITAALLGLKWNKLNFVSGVATNFESEVFNPLLKFCRTTRADINTALGGILSPFETAADEVAKIYEKKLFGKATLQDLPDEMTGPRFTINATNFQLNSLVRFHRDYLADHRVGQLKNPTLPLAKVVAASSAFPPFLSPMVINLAVPMAPLDGADMNIAPYHQRLELTDGGVYDNLGLEAVWKRCEIILVSNAGNPFNDMPNPSNDWMSQMSRAISMIHRQAENNRTRTLLALAKMGKRQVALWNLRAVPPDGALSLSPEECEAVHQMKVDLSPMSKIKASLLLRHGYAMSNAMIEQFWAPATPPATAFPPLFQDANIA